jgi:3-hydroxyisobutyrate dehydrogenase-like beta-hydroxyacid dehydrogenase
VRVGLIGTGVVGRFLGRRLLAAGHDLRVRDRDTEACRALVNAGATAAPSPAETARGCDAVVTALPSGAELGEVLLGPDGIAAGAGPGLVHFETSTIGPARARELAQQAAGREITFVDAPLCAGPLDEDGRQRLTMFVGASAIVFARWKGFVEEMVDQAIFCGPVGYAQVTKLVNNLVTLCTTGVLGEALCLGAKAGVPLEVLRRGLTWGTAQSRLLDEMFPQSVFAGNFRPGYRTRLAAKDWRLMQELAEEVGVPLDNCSVLDRLLEQAQARGWGEDSVHGVVRLCEERSGVELRAAAAGSMDEEH